MARDAVNILGLCSGVGWLEFAVAEVFRARGTRARVVCHCEREATTAALLSRIQSAPSDPLPIWDDLATFDGSPWRGVVDCVVAGLPCPAYSVAGKRLGNIDDRAWGPDGESGPQWHFLRVVREIMPGIVFLENVPPFVSGGHFRRLGEGLLGLGYRIPPAIFLPASAVGATQKRERVFILAYRKGIFKREPDDKGNSKDFGGRAWGVPSERGGGLGLFPPGRGHWIDPEWQQVLEMDATRAPAIEPGFSVVVNGVAVASADLLRIGGNGVVPLAAAVAFNVLLDDTT